MDLTLTLNTLLPAVGDLLFGYCGAKGDKVSAKMMIEALHSSGKRSRWDHSIKNVDVPVAVRVSRHERYRRVGCLCLMGTGANKASGCLFNAHIDIRYQALEARGLKNFIALSYGTV